MFKFDCSVSASKRRPIKYIYELPYRERNMLCVCLDLSNKWRELGSKSMSFDSIAMNRLETAMQRNQSPTDVLLLELSNRNCTILNLFGLLRKIHHYEAMNILKPFVDPVLHKYIKEEEPYSNITACTLVDDLVPQLHPKVRICTSEENILPSMSWLSGKSPRSGSRDTCNALKSELSKLASRGCSLRIPYEDLRSATNNWHKRCILGKGGFGVVYVAQWRNTEVAVKRLESQKPIDPRDWAEIQRKQSLSELKYLNNYKHDNILPLYGYSIDGEKPCLVYQFMSNGSLEDRLMCKGSTKPLTWMQRINIAVEAARGLQFLHGMDPPLIHGDIKSANILLDQNFVAKIGDFGLARDGPVKDFTHVEISKIFGTRVYLPHEFLRGKKLSVKVDTYSFGVVLFELATGLRAYVVSKERRFLKDLCHETDDIFTIMDSKAGVCDADFYLRLMDLGKMCTHDSAKQRPLMVDVFKKLQLLSSKITQESSARRQSSVLHSSTDVITHAQQPQLQVDRLNHRSSSVKNTQEVVTQQLESEEQIMDGDFSNVPMPLVSLLLK